MKAKASLVRLAAGGLIAVLAALAAGTAAQADAKGREYWCAGYARAQATGTEDLDVPLGAGIGAVGGALAAGALTSGISTATAALIGGGAGGAFGLHHGNIYGHIYRDAYFACMRGRVAGDEAAAAEWHAYCASKYRSYNPETGKYLAHSGVYRDCQ